MLAQSVSPWSCISAQNVGLEDTVFREVGPPTVGAEDFELSTELGRMSVQQVRRVSFINMLPTHL